MKFAITSTATVHADRGELRQVFSNLISNALEAAATLVKVRVSPSRDWRTSYRRGVRVTIADNGTGISEESAQHIFEPFFTTKEERGTGLGLWVSKGIIQKHQGWIHMRSSTRECRKGTTISVFLPTVARSTRFSSGVGDAA